MADSCSATRIDVTEVKVETDADKLFEQVLEKFAKGKGITTEEARKHVVMQEIYQCMKEEEKGKCKQ